jgi:hypothetical protein
MVAGADEWARPYAPGRGRFVVAVWELGALAFLHETTVSLYHLERFAAALVAVLFVLWIAMCWRLAVMGVYTGAHGVLIRGFLTRSTISWLDIRRITVHETTLKMGRLSVRTGRAIAFETRTGAVVNSTLYSDGIDFKFRPGLFERVHEDLRRQHDAATLATVER